MTETLIPRLWISPDGRMLDCDEMDMSHSMTVVSDPQVFGLSDMAGQLTRMANEDDFDFDHVIALAEHRGWTRTSRDAAGDAVIALSSASARSASAALRRLERSHRLFPLVVDVEISELAGSHLRQKYHLVRGDDLRPFLKHGRLPPAIHVHEKHVQVYSIAMPAYMAETGVH